MKRLALSCAALFLVAGPAPVSAAHWWEAGPPLPALTGRVTDEARLLSPAVAVQPFEVGKNLPEGPEGKANALWSPYTSQFNLSRHPAASVPCGLSRQGLPIGLQIAAGHYKDALVLRAAARYAETNPLKFLVLPETK